MVVAGESMKKNNLATILENIYLVLFAVFMAYIIISDATMAEIPWPPYFYSDIVVLLFIVIFLRAGLIGNFSKKELFLIGLMGIIFLLDYNHNGANSLINALLLILGARRIPFRKLMSIYLIVTASVILCTNLCSITGIIENLVYYQGSRHRRMALGFTYPTNFAAFVFSCVAVYIYLRGRKLSYIELLGLCGVAGVLYWLTDARTNVLCIFFLIAVAFYYKIQVKIANGKNSAYCMNSVLSTLLALFPVLCAGFTIVLTALYSTDSKFWGSLNRIFNSRLSLGHKAIDVYGFSLWGKSIPSTSFSRVTEGQTRYFFLDISYVRILLMYGILLFICIMIVWNVIAFSARQKKDFILLWIVAIVSLQFVFESRMLHVQYDPFLLCLLANMDQEWPVSGWQNRLTLKLKGKKDA